MKQTTLLIAILLGCLSAYSQSYDLKFSQAINLTNGQSYTVPPNKVFKLESVAGGNTSLTYNLITCSAPQGTCTYRAYRMVIGTYVDSVTTVTYFSNCNCAATVNSNSVSSPSFTNPMWLKSGQVISIAPGSGYLLTGIEFNLQ